MEVIKMSPTPLTLPPVSQWVGCCVSGENKLRNGGDREACGSKEGRMEKNSLFSFWELTILFFSKVGNKKARPKKKIENRKKKKEKRKEKKEKFGVSEFSDLWSGAWSWKHNPESHMSFGAIFLWKRGKKKTKKKKKGTFQKNRKSWPAFTRKTFPIISQIQHKVKQASTVPAQGPAACYLWFHFF